MARVPVKTFRVKMTDWNKVERTTTMTPQNWNIRQWGELDESGLKKFLAAQWKGNGAVVHSVEEVKAEVDVDAFTANRFDPAAKPTIVK